MTDCSRCRRPITAGEAVTTVLTFRRSAQLCQDCAVVWRAEERQAVADAFDSFLRGPPEPIDLQAIAMSIAAP